MADELVSCGDFYHQEQKIPELSRDEILSRYRELIVYGESASPLQ